MTETSFPFDDAGLYEEGWSKMARLWRNTGVVRTGDSVEANKLECYGDSTGMQVKLKTGLAWVKGFYYENDAEQTIAIAAADPSLDRIDVVCIQLDRTNNEVTAEVLTGTPAASPVAPTLTQTSTVWEIPIAEVEVAASASTIAAADVTDTREFSTPTHGTSAQFMFRGGTPSETNGCETGAAIETGSTNKHTHFAMPMVHTSSTSFEFDLPLPDDYDGGVITVDKVYWFCPNASTNGIHLDVQARAFGNSDPFDAAQGTAVAVEDSNNANEDLNIAQPSSNELTIAGSPAAGDLCHFKVTRDHDNANDTLDATIYVLWFVFGYTRAY